MKAFIDDGVLIIELPVFDPPRPSRSGKTRLLASAGRSKRTEIIIDNCPIYINCSAFYYVPEDGSVSNCEEEDLF